MLELPHRCRIRCRLNARCSRALDYIGLNSALNLNDQDLSRKPEKWSGLGKLEKHLLDADLLVVEGAKLMGKNLSYAHASGAFLIKADLTDANLRGADLSGAKLWNATLIGADLSGAYFAGTDLSSIEFSNNDLTGTYLEHAIGLEQHQIVSACADPEDPPSLPESIEPPSGKWAACPE